ncbi:MAG: chaperone NapD [Planctomycetes bacterium]|nr:chaperone NapD [Planctomycetota bacterium]MCW8136384.1 chaperone NapD [Planctomycetota bacterium]
MSSFILAYDIEQQRDVLAALKDIPGVRVTGKPQADGTVRIQTVTRSLDDESAAVHAIEDIPGVIDLRLLEK